MLVHMSVDCRTSRFCCNVTVQHACMYRPIRLGQDRQVFPVPAQVRLRYRSDICNGFKTRDTSSSDTHSREGVAGAQLLAQGGDDQGRLPLTRKLLLDCGEKPSPRSSLTSAPQVVKRLTPSLFACQAEFTPKTLSNPFLHAHLRARR
jgi:hypothetical protein